MTLKPPLYLTVGLLLWLVTKPRHKDGSVEDLRKAGL